VSAGDARGGGGPGLLRVAVVGATGSLGAELVAALEERGFPASALVPIATDRSLGREVEFAGESLPVQTDVRTLEGVDLAFLCAPEAASLGFARMALEARAACIDLSGALAEQADVPLLVADWLSPETELAQPLVAGPPAPALALALALAPLRAAAGLRRVVATTFEAASVGGRGGMDALSDQSVALFNLQEPAEGEGVEAQVAFACLPAIGALEDGGATHHEARLARVLARLFDAPLPLAVTAVRVPTFSGDGVALAVETERPLGPDAARAALEKAPGVELWPGADGPTTRTAVGRDAVLVGRVRRDPSCERGLLLWLAADGLRLAAANAVKLAEARPLRRRA
jgi:aspartate-semialdehyde dehydrogenase